MPSISASIRAFLALALLSVTGAAAPGAGAESVSGVVVSQIYGGGGSSSATYASDFLELHNTRAVAIDLSGWSVQYAPATGAHWRATAISGSIAPGGYYLVKESTGTTGAVLPAPDATGTLAMSASAGKVALVTSATPLTCSPSCPGATGVEDFVGYGSTADEFEGDVGPAPTPSATRADLRLNGGQTDNDDNADDFAARAPTPRNSASPARDVTPPTVTRPPKPVFIRDSQLRATTVPIRITWGATDDSSGVCSYSLAEKIDGGPYTGVALPSATATQVTVFLAPGSTAYRFRVSATDCAGNPTPTPTPGRAFTLTALQETDSRIAYSAGWTREALAGAYGGSVKYSTAAGATATLSVTGHAVAWVVPRDATRGKADVSLDGTTIATVDLASPSPLARRVVWAANVQASATHALKLTNDGTAGRPRIDVDAVLVLS